MIEEPEEPEENEDPRTPDEILADEARATKDEPPETNPDAINWPEDVRTERIEHEDV